MLDHSTKLCSIVAAVLATMLVSSPGAAQGAKTTECTKIGICYCVSSDLKPMIDARIARYRQLAEEAHKAGKAVVTPTFGPTCSRSRRTSATVAPRLG